MTKPIISAILISSMESTPTFVRISKTCYIAISKIVTVNLPLDIHASCISLYTNEHDGALYNTSPEYNVSILSTLGIPVPTTHNE